MPWKEKLRRAQDQKHADLAAEHVTDKKYILTAAQWRVETIQAFFLKHLQGYYMCYGRGPVEGVTVDGVVMVQQSEFNVGSGRLVSDEPFQPENGALHKEGMPFW